MHVFYSFLAKNRLDQHPKIEIDMNASVIVQSPKPAADSLILLFHGVGSDPENMVPVAQTLAALQPGSMVVSVASPDTSDFGRGYQWFSVAGITEENRANRIAAAMPQFKTTVEYWQQRSGCGPENTTLIGFSQGAIMSLEATQLSEAIAARVIAIAGRFAKLPEQLPVVPKIVFLHGEQDAVVSPVHSVQASQRINDLGGAASIQLFPGLGHGIDGRVLQAVSEALQ
jgi:phospholipase/carboxylesterase